MNEAKLTELLEHAGDRTTVNPPPIDAMRSGATRRRRRRTAVWSAAGTALAVAGVIGASTVLTNNDATPLQQPPVAANPVPAGMRLVGVGHVAIAVPNDWSTNKLTCGTPTEDSVIVDPGPQGYCFLPRPEGVESIELGPLPEKPAKPDGEIDGVPVARQREKCIARDADRSDTCTASVQIPSLKLAITATVQGEGTRPTLMLEQIRIVPDLTGVPGYGSLDLETSGTKYTAELLRAGLKVRTKFSTKVQPGAPKGSVVEVWPAPGTMVPNGSMVTVTLAG